jgi:hypothetical protein
MKQDNRKYQRLAKECRVEYCLFKSIVTKEGLRESSLKDLGGGGASFYASENYDNGTQLYLKVYVPGWSQNNGELKQVADNAAEVMLETIAEVIHTECGDGNDKFLIGTRFLGKVNK